jgi:hypothetical protein
VNTPARDERDESVDITSDAERARFRLEVTRQRLRLTKEQLQRARRHTRRGTRR